MVSDHMAYVIDEDGVTETPFRRTPGTNQATNVEAITLRPGAVLDLGNGMVIVNTQTAVKFTITPPPQS